MSGFLHLLVDSCQNLFTGRIDVYARAYAKDGFPGKVGYALVKEPLTVSVWEAHLRGEQLIGQYQLNQDSTVGWFALDFDDQEEGSVHEQAVKQLRAFEDAGLQVYLEQSRSGTGYHVWGFLDGPRPAAEVRHVLTPLLLQADALDRLYPVQVTITEGRPYGNLIALPFFGAMAPAGWSSDLGGGVPAGAGVFLDPDTLTPHEPLSFCDSVYKNTGEVLEELLESLPPAKTDRSGVQLPTLPKVEWGQTEPIGRPASPVQGVLKVISDFGCSFMKHAWENRRTLPEPEWYVAIQQLTCFRHGREAAHLLSQDHPEYSAVETDRKFTHALRSPPAGCRYIQEHFPRHACEGCPHRAPWQSASVPIRELVAEDTSPLLHSDYRESLARMRRRSKGEQPSGTTWGIAGLDGVTRLRSKELTVVGAMPSIGKTALMVDAEISLTLRGVPVMTFSAETGREGLEDRRLARVSGVDSRAIRGERIWNGNPLPMRPEEDTAVEEAARVLSRLPLFTHYSATVPDNILDLIEDTALRHRVSLSEPFVVFMDYLQFGTTTMSGRADNDYERLSLLSQEFKYIAKILRQPVVVFSQLRRDKEGGEEPQITWFKGTGRIEADADVAMILTGERVPGPVATRKLTIVKQREGDAGVCRDLILHQAVSRFEWADHGTVEDTAKDMFSEERNELTDF